MSNTTQGDFELITRPVSPVINTCDLNKYLRLAGSEDDALVSGWQSVAVEYVESDTRRQLVTATWKLHLDCFPAVIDIKKMPVSSVDLIRYVDIDGTWQTRDASEYDVDLTHSPAQVRPAYNKYWPTARPTNNAVEVTFKAGYGRPDDVPQIAKQIIYLIVNASYSGCDNPDAVSDLLTKLYWGS